MNCISSPALDDIEILIFVDGEAGTGVVTHITKCPFCAEKARQWSQLQNRLKARLYRSDCPPSMVLVDYQLKWLSGPEVLAVVQHLRECPSCRREMDRLKTMWPGSSHSNEELAMPTQGSVFSPELGIRGEQKGKINIEADGIHILLDVQKTADGRMTLRGNVVDQVGRSRLPGARVELEQTGVLIIEASLDEDRQFTLENVQPGTVRFIVKPPHGEPIYFKLTNIGM